MRRESNNYNSNKIFFLKTEGFPNKITSLIHPRVRIKSMQLSYPYCYKHSGMIAIEVSRDNWQEESDLLSAYDGAVPIDAIIVPLDKNIRRHTTYKLKPIFREIIRDPRGLGVEFELTDILLKNNTLVYGYDSGSELTCDKTSPAKYGKPII